MISGLGATINIRKMYGFFNGVCIIGSDVKFNCTAKDIPYVPRSVFQTVSIADIFWRYSMTDNMATLCHIDEKASLWGLYLACEYAEFVPLILSIFACIWFVIFAMCGHGGRGTDAWADYYIFINNID